MKTKFLTIEDIEKTCFEYARARLTFNEPIPNFNTRFPGKLESCLSIPQRTYNDKLFYKTLPQQAAVLFYEIIKIHPFLNGNKRIAMVSFMVFLALNKKWIHVSWRKLYDIAIRIAKSNPKNRKNSIKSFSNFIKNNLVTFEKY